MNRYYLLLRSAEEELTGQYRQELADWVRHLSRCGNYIEGAVFDGEVRLVPEINVDKSPEPCGSRAGCYLVIAAASIDHAADIAADCPIPGANKVEVYQTR
jgi:hypothetical protein